MFFVRGIYSECDFRVNRKSFFVVNKWYLCTSTSYAQHITHIHKWINITQWELEPRSRKPLQALHTQNRIYSLQITFYHLEEEHGFIILLNVFDIFKIYPI